VPWWPPPALRPNRTLFAAGYSPVTHARGPSQLDDRSRTTRLATSVFRFPGVNTPGAQHLHRRAQPHLGEGAAAALQGGARARRHSAGALRDRHPGHLHPEHPEQLRQAASHRSLRVEAWGGGPEHPQGESRPLLFPSLPFAPLGALVEGRRWGSDATVSINVRSPPALSAEMCRCFRGCGRDRLRTSQLANTEESYCSRIDVLFFCASRERVGKHGRRGL